MRNLIKGGILFFGILSAGCSHGFVTMVPPYAGGTAVKAAPAQPQTGYLRAYFWSDLSALTRAAKGYEKFDGDIYSLAVTVEPLIGAHSEGEFPLATYDLKSRTLAAVAGINMNLAQYVDVASSNQAAFKFHVRAVPKSIATAYRQAMSEVESIAGALPTSTISSWVPQLQGATKVLSAFSEAAARSEDTKWTSEWTVGVSSNEGTLPMDDTPYTIYLVPTARTLDLAKLTAGAHYCSSNHSRLCKGSSPETYFTAVPYITIRARMESYRPITDFTLAINCSRDASDLPQIRKDLATAGMTRDQRSYAGYLADRLETLVAMREQGALNNVNRLADFAYRYTNVLIPRAPELASDVMWKNHYEPDARTLERCIDAEPRTVFTTARRWSGFIKSMSSMSTWRTDYERSQDLTNDDARIGFLEGIISKISSPFDAGVERKGEVAQQIEFAVVEVEKELRPLYERKRQQIVAASADKAILLAQQLQGNPTLCESCKPIIVAAVEVAERARRGTPEAVAPRVELASAVRAADAVIATADRLNVANPTTERLKRTVDEVRSLATRADAPPAPAPAVSRAQIENAAEALGRTAAEAKQSLGAVR